MAYPGQLTYGETLPVIVSRNEPCQPGNMNGKLERTGCSRWMQIDRSLPAIGGLSRVVAPCPYYILSHVISFDPRKLLINRNGLESIPRNTPVPVCRERWQKVTRERYIHRNVSIRERVSHDKLKTWFSHGVVFRLSARSRLIKIQFSSITTPLSARYNSIVSSFSGETTSLSFSLNALAVISIISINSAGLQRSSFTREMFRRRTRVFTLETNYLLNPLDFGT